MKKKSIIYLAVLAFMLITSCSKSDLSVEIPLDATVDVVEMNTIDSEDKNPEISQIKEDEKVSFQPLDKGGRMISAYINQVYEYDSLDQSKELIRAFDDSFWFADHAFNPKNPLAILFNSGNLSDDKIAFYLGDVSTGEIKSVKILDVGEVTKTLWSPDGKSIALVIYNYDVASNQLYVYDVDNEQANLVMSSEINSMTWSADGSNLLFESEKYDDEKSITVVKLHIKELAGDVVELYSFESTMSYYISPLTDTIATKDEYFAIANISGSDYVSHFLGYRYDFDKGKEETYDNYEDFYDAYMKTLEVSKEIANDLYRDDIHELPRIAYSIDGNDLIVELFREFISFPGWEVDQRLNLGYHDEIIVVEW